MIKIRYPLSVIGMVAGIIFAYYSFLLAGKMLREERKQTEDIEINNQSQNVIGVDLLYDGEGEDIFPMFKEENVWGNISSLPLYCDDEDSVCLINAYIFMPKEFPYMIAEGSLPTMQQMDDGLPVIILGKGLKNKVHKKDGGDYYRVCGEDYRVAAYISSEESHSLDSARILFYDCLGSRAKEDIDYFAQTMGLRLFFGSDVTDIFEYYQGKEKLLKDKVISIHSSKEIWNDNFTFDVSLVSYQKYAYLLYLFSVFLCIIIIELWLVQRKKEFAIRRAIGYSKNQIISLIAKELVKIILISGSILFVIQLIFQKITNDAAYEGEWIADIGISLVFIIITFVLLMIYPIYKIMTESVVSSMGGVGDS